MSAHRTREVAPWERSRGGGPAIADLVDEMTLAEKVGQMALADVRAVTPDDVTRWSLGAVFSGGGANPPDGTAAGWRRMVVEQVEASLRTRLGIPILYGTDAVHGHNNVVGATIFPHHIGLGAAGDADLVRRIARAAALETAATGARWSFAPCLAVPGDHRWGRTFEGFSSDPDLVTRLGRAAVEGWHGDDLRSDGVLACPKHFVGEGAMVWGTAGPGNHPWIDWWDGWGDTWQIDQGDITIDEAELRAVHLPPFVAALEAGALTVMAGYASFHGERTHGHRGLLTDLLKGEMGFTGFVVSDWMAVDQIHADYGWAVEHAVNAGVDMVMVPFEIGRFLTTLTTLVDEGRIPTERIDDAVHRILTAKTAVIGDDPLPSLDVVGCAAHRDLARTAARAGVVSLLDPAPPPIPADASVVAAGQAIDDVGLACGGWTISWEGSPGPITPGSTVLDGLRRLLGDDRVHYAGDADAGDEHAPVGIVSVHEEPYVEGHGDAADPSVPEDQVAVVRRLRARVDRLIVLVVSGRPLRLGEVAELADDVWACWLPGSEADGIAELLLGHVPPRGRLPLPWPIDQEIPTPRGSIR